MRELGRRFWTVLAAATASNVGDGVVLAALPLMAASLTREPLGVAAVTISARLPWLVFGLFAGVLADRLDRLKLMVASDACRAVVFAVMAIVIASREMNLALLYVTVFGVGMLETLFDTAAMSMTPALVRTDQLERANGLVNSVQIVANEFIGPPLGGALFALVAAAPFGLNAVTFASSVLILLTVGGRYRPERSTPTSVVDDIKTGFGFVWREPLIRAFAVGAGVINLGFTAAASVLVLHAQDNLGLDEVGFGLLLVGGALGAVTGAQMAPWLVRRAGRRRSLLLSVSSISAGLALVGWATTMWAGIIGFSLFGFAGEIWNIVSVTYRQSVTPDALLGRVMSGFRVIAYGAFPLGAAIGGLVATITTVRTNFFLGAGVILALLPYLTRVTRLHSLNPTV